ncbi:MAG: hypothetical protein FJ320_08210 [SAR202 cluster bacterium]|nr:hypothetical protein [SAR202 cluster bacterium]
MVADGKKRYLYVGLGGEGEHIGSGGLYRRRDGEREWESINSGLPKNPQVRALAAHPQKPNIVFAGTQEGPYRSDDFGHRWEPLEVPGGKGDVWSLAFHPKNPKVIFAGYEPCAIFCSEDGGDSWRRMDTRNVIFPHITTYMPPLGKRVIEIAFDPVQPQDMYAAIEVGGLLASKDGGESWESIIDGPYVKNNTLDLHGVQVSPALPGTVFIVTQTAMFRSRDRGRRWEHVRLEEMFPGGTYCRDLAISPHDSRTMYLAAGAGGGSAMGAAEKGALFQSRDAGGTWSQIGPNVAPTSRMFQVAVDPLDSDRIFCCARAGQVYESLDGGNTWVEGQVPGEMSRSRHVYVMTRGR